MKHLPQIIAILLGLAFLFFGANFFLKFVQIPGSSVKSAHSAPFFGALVGSGFLAFVKALQIIGGILVSIPKTRNLGLLVLCPIIINIIAVNGCINGPMAIFQLPIILVSAFATYLLILGRSKFKQLLG